jgi:hypothetical protein
MRFDSCEEILEDFIFLKSVIENLTEDNFPYMTRNEIEEEKIVWMEEIKMEYAFKLLSRIEAEIRTEFNRTISSKRRDPLSRAFSELCDEYRRKKGDYARSRKQVCETIGLEAILKCLTGLFKMLQDSFHSKCSMLKGHMTFRHWYAHGRYFRERPPVPDPEELVDIYDIFQLKVFNRSFRSAQ